jgi:hypothetical protein
MLDVGPPLPPRSFCVQVKQVTAPNPPTRDENYKLLITVPLPGGLEYQLLTELEQPCSQVFRTKSITCFDYDEILPHVSLDFALMSRSNEEIASVNILLDWFPPNTKTTQQFPMHSLSDLALRPILFLDVHHNFSETVNRWDAPYGVISVREKEPLLQPVRRSSSSSGSLVNGRPREEEFRTFNWSFFPSSTERPVRYRSPPSLPIDLDI